MVRGKRFFLWVARRRAQRWVMRGENYLAQGELEKAFACSKKSISIDGSFRRGYSLMHKALFPGDNYLAILSGFHERLAPESYVEIGVAAGQTLALAKNDTKVVGIDPNPCITKTIESRAKIFPITSDDFFESYDLLKGLDTTKLALAFIDGLHHFDQALKDFINLERYAYEETIILIHDCLPITRLVSRPIRATPFWTGDVWKIIPCLKKYRSDLKVHVIPADPSGLGIITNLDPNSTVLQNKFSQIDTDYRDLDFGYDYLDLDKNTIVNMPNNWQNIAQIIPLSLSKSKPPQQNQLVNSGSGRGPSV